MWAWLTNLEKFQTLLAQLHVYGLPQLCIFRENVYEKFVISNIKFGKKFAWNLTFFMSLHGGKNWNMRLTLKSFSFSVYTCMLQDNFHSVSSIIIIITYFVWLYYRSQALSFSINKFPQWCDVIVTSSDGVEVKCHKCVLISRMEYFRTMLTGHWYEVSAAKLFYFFVFLAPNT